MLIERQKTMITDVVKGRIQLLGLMAGLLMLLSACSSDNPSSDQLIGTWELQTSVMSKIMNGEVIEKVEDTVDPQTVFLTFSEDGTLISRNVHTGSRTYEWTLDGNTLRFQYEFQHPGGVVVQTEEYTVSGLSASSLILENVVTTDWGEIVNVNTYQRN